MSQEQEKELETASGAEKEIAKKAVGKAVRLAAIQARQPKPNRMQRTEFTREQ